MSKIEHNTNITAEIGIMGYKYLDISISHSNSTAYRFFPWLMIFSIILICLLGRDFGCMLKAERASKSGPSQTLPNGTTAAAIRSGPTPPSPSINCHNDDGSGDDELESSVTAESERGQGCCTCCHSNTRRRGRGREGNEGAVTEGTEMRRCGSEERNEDLDESVFTGQFHCVYNNNYTLYYYIMCCVWFCIYESIRNCKPISYAH